MRRAVFKLFVFLALGAAVNVAVAWGCRSVSLATFAAEQGSILDGRPAPIYVIGRSKPGHARLEVFPVRRPTEFFEGMPDYLEGDRIHPRMLGAGPSVSFAWPSNFHAAASGLGDQECLQIELIGWPFSALQASRHTNFANELARIRQRPHDGGLASDTMALIWRRSWSLMQDEPDLPPWRPCWPGFMYNTLIFAIASAALTLLARFVVAAVTCLSPTGRAQVLALAVFLGLVSTIAAAWASAIWDARDPDRHVNPDVRWGGNEAERANATLGYRDWRIMRDDGLTSVHCTSWWTDGDHVAGLEQGFIPFYPAEPLVPYWGSMLRPTARTGRHGHAVSIHAHGWPMCALWWGRLDGAGDDISRATIRGLWLSSGKRSLPWGGTQDVEHVLPLQPIWFGLLMDVITGAAVWLVMVSGFIHLTAGKRRRRMRRGLCPHCKYPIGTSPVCTECGGSVTPKPAGVAA